MGVMRTCDERGQMTVELAAAFPVLIIVAVIAVNALAFFSECAAFDNVFRDAVRVHVTSPAAGQGIEQSSALVQTALSCACRRRRFRGAIRASRAPWSTCPRCSAWGCARRCSGSPCRR